MTVFFTADTHFGDHRTINIHGRPFGSVAEMDAMLVDRWNSTVGVDDEVWHLGDVARRPQDVAGLLEQLNGTKHLIRGNNDPDTTLTAPGWCSVGDYAEIVADGHRLVLCHYPFRSWNGQHRKSLNLHGHSHGRLKPMLRQYDVGVDVHDYAPVTLARLLSAVSKKEDRDAG
ncbi:metallophosphoesterase family protein [Sphingomonas sp. 1P08PE]|uniref:metallophosphoesterase family protein n=1 Tax=Sphingomonas sp. 1P08PE TaxID=554122 RepID=UPI0039A32D36